MNIKPAKQYEDWLAARTRLVPDDLALKHKRMAQRKGEGRFMFFRATFYRWAQIWPELCAELVRAPIVLAIGDLQLLVRWHKQKLGLRIHKLLNQP